MHMRTVMVNYKQNMRMKMANVAQCKRAEVKISGHAHEISDARGSEYLAEDQTNYAPKTAI